MSGDQQIEALSEVNGDAFVVEQPTAATPRSSFDGFYQSEYVAVVTLAAVLTGSRAVAEDIAQEAFASTFARWEELEHPAAWVRRVVANLCASWVRRRVREVAALRRFRNRQERGPLLADLAADDYWATVRELPNRQAQCVALHYLEDLSTADIADILGIAEATVRVHLHHGRRELALRLGELLEDE
jgi:RNA polymerase sigma-70 factor (ECF subfamily)